MWTWDFDRNFKFAQVKNRNIIFRLPLLLFETRTTFYCVMFFGKEQVLEIYISSVLLKIALL